MKKLLFIIFLILPASLFAAEKVIIFAAASLTNALNDVITLYNKEYKGNAIGSYDSSGNLARQIVAGAPAAIFLSADKKWMKYLSEKKMLEENSVMDLLGNSIVVITNINNNLKSFDLKSKPDLKKMLNGGKLAIGNPESVPCGTYAKESLLKLNLWKSIENDLAMAQNVRVALSYVVQDECKLGIVFGTDASQAKKSVKVIATLPEDTYPRATYPIAIVKGKRDREVESLYNFLISNKAKAIYKQYGFSVE